MQAEISGASIRKVGGRPYVVVDPRLMFQDGPPTIHGIAQRLMLADAAVFSSLLDNALNAHALRKLWADNVGTCDDAPAPRDLAALRTALKIAGTTFTADDDRFPNGTRTPYVGWTVDAAKPLVFPRTAAFVKLQRLERERRARQERFHALEADFSRLERMRRELHGTAQDLYEGVIKYYDEWLEPIKGDLLLVIGSQVLLEVLIDAPRAPPSAGDLRDMRDLKARFDRLATEMMTYTVLEPPDEFLNGFAGRRKRYADSLSAQLHDEAFVDEVRVLVANLDVAPPSLLSGLCETVILAYRCLALTHRTEEVERDCGEVLDIIASRHFDTSGLTAQRHPSFAKLVKMEPAAPEPSSVPGIIAKALTAATLAVGELPGPSSFASCAVELFGMVAAPRIMSNPAVAGPYSARLYRFLVNGAGLSRVQRVELLLAIDAGDLGALKKIQWTSRFMNGAGWSAAMAIANLAAFFCLAAKPGGVQPGDIADLAGSATGAALGILQALGEWSTVCRLGAASQFARVAGVVGGLAAVASGYLAVREDLGIGDETGAWIHGAGAAGGAVSVAGFLLAGGASATGSIAGAPVGVVLMAAGALIGIGAVTVDVYRSATEANSKELFQRLLDAVSRSGAFRELARCRPPVERTLEAVRARRGIDFWEIHPSAAPRLRAARFPDDVIARLTK